jgi:hypothetical protein
MFTNHGYVKLNMDLSVVSVTKPICCRDKAPLHSRITGPLVSSSLNTLRPRCALSAMDRTLVGKNFVGYQSLASVTPITVVP